MKKVITILVIMLSMQMFSQSLPPSQLQDSISNVSIKSKIPLSYSSRENKVDTIYVSMVNWNYVPEKKVAVGFLKEYVKQNNKFREIGTTRVLFSRAEINNAFTALNLTIVPTDKFVAFLEDFLVKSLLKEVKKTIDADGKTIYGGIPTNWQIIQ